MLVHNSYTLAEEKSQNSRNLNLNLNLQSITQTQITSDIDHNEDFVDENTKLLSMEKESFAPDTRINGNGNLKSTENTKIHYNMNITNNNLCNDSSVKTNFNNNSIIKNSEIVIQENVETDTETTNQNNVNNNDDTSGDKKTIKMTKFGSKNVTLKRVSFGSSKGSMVETLIFETPTPIFEREFFPETNQESNNETLHDSGIQEEFSKEIVTFYQANKPQQISPPCGDNQFCFGENYFNNNSLIDSFLLNSSLNETDSMTAVIPDYNRQISTDSGWDNPFRPDGDLSREADEIVNLIKGGKPITPTGDQTLMNGSHVIAHETNGNSVVDGATKLEASPLLNQANGTKSPQKGEAGNGEATKESQPKVSIQTVPGQQSASCVVIEDKKKKKSCCVIQ